MHDDERWTLEPVQGRRAPSSPGERAAVGLGIFLVLAAVVFGIANLLDFDLRIAMDIRPTASPQPSATRTPHPTPTPRPLREVALELGSPPAEEPYPLTRGAWVEALVDLPIVTQPEGSNTRGVLAAGAVAYVEVGAEGEGEPGPPAGWAQIIDPGPHGWIDVSDPELAKVTEHTWWAPAVELWRLAAGPDRYVALGDAGGDYTEGRGSSLFVSSDGVEWSPSSLPGARQWGGMVAYGPAGWLAAVEDRQGGIWVAASEDAAEWEWLGGMRLTTGGYPLDLVGSQDGYAMLLMDWDSGIVRPWFSSDGIWWREGADPGLGPHGSGRITPLLGGYFVWSATEFYGGPGSAGRAAFSSDGRTWAEVSPAPIGVNPQLAGPLAMAIDADPESGETRVWLADRSAGRLVWTRDAQAERALAGSVVSALASDERSAWAFGWDRQSQEAQAWRYDGSSWREVTLPEAFVAVPRLVAAGPAGFVAVSGTFGDRGLHPTFWHLRDGEWRPEPDPVFGDPPAIDRAACGPPPDSLVGVITIDPALTVACHGGRDLTLHAWSMRCDGCAYRGNGRYEPEWLMAPTDNQLYLSPFRSDGQWVSAVLPPDLELQSEWREAWLEITAHYDDPAAMECRTDPGPDEMAWWVGAQPSIDRCRQTLVVSEVRVLDVGEDGRPTP